MALYIVAVVERGKRSRSCGDDKLKRFLLKIISLCQGIIGMECMSVDLATLFQGMLNLFLFLDFGFGFVSPCD